MGKLSGIMGAAQQGDMGQVRNLMGAKSPFESAGSQAITPGKANFVNQSALAPLQTKPPLWQNMMRSGVMGGLQAMNKNPFYGGQ